MEAKKETLKSFIKQLPNGVPDIIYRNLLYRIVYFDLESVRNEYRRMITSLSNAWKLVGQRLSTHGDKLQLSPSLSFMMNIHCTHNICRSIAS